MISRSSHFILIHTTLKSCFYDPCFIFLQSFVEKYAASCVIHREPQYCNNNAKTGKNKNWILNLGNHHTHDKCIATSDRMKIKPNLQIWI